MAKKKLVRKPANLSLAELKQMVESRSSELSALKTQRAELQKAIDELDKSIAETEGTGGTGGTGKRRGRPPGAAAAASAGIPRKKAARKVKRPRPKNEKSQKDYAIEVLEAAPQGLPLNQLAAKILETGYKSNSKNFQNTLYQMLYNSRKAGKTFNYNEKTGNWVLR